ncbi:MAG TPA: glycosyltransferase family 39 protein [Solirubrobacterales bacterium]|nr:glycosyltransferase family 39 protein [Solirubrobacterales bacterium]
MERLQSAFGGSRAALALAVVFAIGLGLRLDYAIRAPHEPVDDSRAYARIAASLHEGDGFTQGDDPRHRALQPATNYTPGLPLLVAGVYELRGEVDRAAARTVLAILSALAIPLTFLLGKRLGGTAAGLLAAVPIAIYPALLDYTGMLMTEPVGTAVLAGLLLAFVRACEASSPGRWALAGVLQGALAMLRPECLLLVPLLALAAAWLRSRRAGRSWRATAVPVALMAGCACLVILPWTVRNLVVLDRLVPLSTGGGQLLYQGGYVPAGPDSEDITPTLLEEHPWIRRELGPLPGPIYRGQVVEELAAREYPGEDPDVALRRMGRDQYFDNLTEQPLDLAAFVAGKVWLAWTGTVRTVMERPVWKAFHLSLMAFALIGLVLGLRRRSPEAVAIAVVVATATLSQAVFIASPRRVLLVLPAASALGGLGVTWLAARAREAARP